MTYIDRQAKIKTVWKVMCRKVKNEVQWMKKILIMLFLVMGLVCFSGCGDDTKEEQDKEDSKLKYTVEMEGTVKSYTGDELVMITSDKRELEFDTEGASLELKNGIVAGNAVTVYFTGSVKNTDTSNVTVKKLVVQDENTGDVNKLLTLQPEAFNPEDVQDEELPETETREEELGTAVERVNETVIAESAVNFRELPQKESTVKGALKAGEEVKRTGICANGWSQVLVDGETVYIWGEYLSEAGGED